MNTIDNPSLQSTVIDSLTPKPSHSAVATTNANTPTISQDLQTQTDHSYLNDIHPEQVREFLINHVNRRLNETPANNADVTNEYDSVASTESDLGIKLTQSVSQAYLVTGQTPEEIQVNVTKAFHEVSEALHSTNSLPENLENEFTRLKYSISDFITRLNELGKSGINFENGSIPNPPSNIEIETKNGDTISIEIAQTSISQTSNIALYDSQYAGSNYSSLTDSSAGLAISVSSSLSENKLSSIKDLVKSIGETANQFDRVSVNTALNSLQEIRQAPDSALPARTSLNHDQQKAASSYHQAQTSNLQNDSLVSPQLLGQTARLIGQAEQTTDLKEIIENIRDLYEGFYQQLEQTSETTNQSQKAADVLNNMLSV